MTILIEALALRNQNSGVGNYSLQLIKHLIEALPSEKFLVIHDSKVNLKDLGIKPESIPNWTFKGIQTGGKQLVGLFNLSLQLKRVIEKENIKLIHGLSAFLPLGPKRNGVIYLTTVHDVFPIVQSTEVDFKSKLYFQRFGVPSIKRADEIIAVSQNTKRDIIKTIRVDSEKITVIYEAAAITLKENLYFTENPATTQARVLKKFGLPFKNFILFVGAARKIKGLGTLLESYQKLLNQGIKSPLVIAGDGALSLHPIKFKRFSEIIAKSGGSLTFTGRISEPELISLYQSAKVFVLPSFYEGFGLTAIEAMKCGCPVIARESSSMPEVIGDAGLYFNSPEELTEKLTKVLTNPILENQLIQKGFEREKFFSWKATASETLSVYRRLLNIPSPKAGF
ncbi:MAG: glycosyltransferase family 1 protein [Chloroherpetonaceae bacterium]|nr:glycosyltransferase family 1 protein [Chloroherpetonaceae bacterium]